MAAFVYNGSFVKIKMPSRENSELKPFMNSIHRIGRFAKNKKTYIIKQSDLAQYIKTIFTINYYSIEIKEINGGECRFINNYLVFIKYIQYTLINSFTLCVTDLDKIVSNLSLITHILNYEDPLDEYFLYQWYLFPIKVLPVWKDYTGKGVKIAVYDDDCILQHPDLTIVRGKESLKCDSQSSSQHALAVAGIISAIPNTIGIIGIAHNARVESIPFLLSDTSSHNFKWAVNYDIINNSWAQMKLAFDYTLLPKFFHEMLMDIKTAATLGRNGLGTIFVFAAGNEYDLGLDPNFDIRKHNPYSIVVGGYNMPGYEKKFACHSALILVAAPCTHFPLLQAVNITGVSFGHGVSFAAPVVTSIIALMLEANSELSWRDIKEILAISSIFPKEKLKDASVNNAKHINGQGAQYSPELSFGIVNALAAARLAPVFDSLSNYQKYQSKASFIDLDELDSKGIYKWGFEILSTIQVEYVRIYIEIVLPYSPSQTSIILFSPLGTSSLLMYRPGVNPRTGELIEPLNGLGLKLKWIFGSENFRGETCQGEWQIHLFNHGNKAVAPKLISASIELTGDYNQAKEIFFTPNLEHFHPHFHQITIEPSINTINTVTIQENVIIAISGNSESIILKK